MERSSVFDGFAGAEGWGLLRGLKTMGMYRWGLFKYRTCNRLPLRYVSDIEARIRRWWLLCVCIYGVVSDIETDKQLNFVVGYISFLVLQHKMSLTLLIENGEKR